MSLLDELNKYKTNEYNLINTKQELVLIVDELRNNTELTKKEKEVLLIEKQQLEKEKQDLSEELFNYKEDFKNKIHELDYIDGKAKYFEESMQRIAEEKKLTDFNFSQIQDYLLNEKKNNEFQIKVLQDQSEEIKKEFKQYINEKEREAHASEHEKKDILDKSEYEKSEIIRQAWQTINDLKEILNQKNILVEQYELKIKENSAEKIKITDEEYIENIKDQDYQSFKSAKRKSKEKKDYITEQEKKYKEQLERDTIRQEMINFNRDEKQINNEAEKCNKKLLKFFRNQHSPEKLKMLIQQPITDYGFNPYTPTKPYIPKQNFNFPPNISDFSQNMSNYLNKPISDYGYNPKLSPVKKNPNNLPPLSSFKEHEFDYDTL